MWLRRRQLSSLARAVRVRFAPSPTGEMHIGGLRTALYNYLFAKKNNGDFILRIEDTDRSRLVEGAQERIVDTLRWAGLTPDEGPGYLGGTEGPYLQSERLHFYREFIQKLEDKGAAYKCFCTERRLDLLRKDANKRKALFKYDNKCRNLTSKEKGELLAQGTPHVYRFKLRDGSVSFHDLIHGESSIELSRVEADFVILKSDGYPTYHFANVVDDYLMNISHVLRGVEWHVSTPKHLQIFEALELPPPTYAHLPLMMNQDGSKLSKRNKGFMCDQLREKYIPEAVLSFLLLSGGGFGKTTGDFHRLQDLIQKFNIESMNTSSCKIDFARLEDMNFQAIRIMADELYDAAFLLVRKHYPHVEEDYFRRVFKINAGRLKFLDDIISPQLNFLWTKDSSVTEPLGDDWKTTILSLTKVLETISFGKADLSTSLREFHSSQIGDRLSYRDFMWKLREILTGLKEGPSISEIMESLGREETIARLLDRCS
ncbi:probable glutamate--tRNA ligase, mitochondrial [Galendromus occidentalis]|uniref:Nondiscriminating glutamyl-tRNA synthetase EARS2, mitochondrial n=1 Tax=Galendromus occidentalis TaxID=34638 RepID=A0AAJ6QSQ2_9ACAR|nr:probable glutamate--tRNA ligase, mitochondrial [Galendromus occidentalis]